MIDSSLERSIPTPSSSSVEDWLVNIEKLLVLIVPVVVSILNRIAPAAPASESSKRKARPETRSATTRVVGEDQNQPGEEPSALC